MKSKTVKHLRLAQKQLGDCTRNISQRKNPSGTLTLDEREMIIGLGTARDWVRWAVALKDLTFTRESESKSSRTQGITESVRFNLLWTGANALFAKDSVLSAVVAPASLSPATKGSEQKRFAALYASANIDAVEEKDALQTLHDLLSMECKAQGVVGELKADGTPTMWEIIYHKYMRPKDRGCGLGKILSPVLEAAKKANAAPASKRIDHPMPNIDGPTLIYAARNWAVHGMLLTSFFRGSREKYLTFSENITFLLAATLDGASRKLLTRL